MGPWGTGGDMLDASMRDPVVLASRLTAWNLYMGATWAGWLSSGLGIAIGEHPSLRLDHDVLGTKVGIGITSSIRPGYYAAHWSLALDLANTTVVATHISNSAVVRAAFDDRYPDRDTPSSAPRDGWYGLTAARHRAGLAVGGRPWEHVALHLVGGFAYTPALEDALMNPPIAPLPFYIEAGAQFRW